MRTSGVALLILGLAGPAVGGEILFTNGGRLEGELANETLVVSTASGLVEVAPEQVLMLTREDILLKDGRAIHGTLVGNRVKAETAWGELAIAVGELQAYTTTRPVARTAPEPTGAPDVRAGSGRGLFGGGVAEASTTRPEVVAGNGSGATGTPSAKSRWLEVVAPESPLYRDAFAAASRIGRVVRGQLLTYLDFIDRRLRVLNTLIFDGGYWIKVRAPDGTEGWITADSVREVR